MKVDLSIYRGANNVSLGVDYEWNWSIHLGLSAFWTVEYTALEQGNAALVVEHVTTI